MCHTTHQARVGPRGNLSMKRSNEHKTLSVDLLVTKVYCYCLFTVISEKRETECWESVKWLDRDYKPYEAKGTVIDLIISSPYTQPPLPSGLRLSSVASLLLLQFTYSRESLSYTEYLNIHGIQVTVNNSTNNYVVLFFVLDLNIVYYNNY